MDIINLQMRMLIQVALIINTTVKQPHTFLQRLVMCEQMNKIFSAAPSLHTTILLKFTVAQDEAYTFTWLLLQLISHLDLLITITC